MTLSRVVVLPVKSMRRTKNCLPSSAFQRWRSHLIGVGNDIDLRLGHIIDVAELAVDALVRFFRPLRSCSVEKTSPVWRLTKVYSQFGYIDYVAEPQIDIVPNSNKIDLTLNADQQFFVRRIDFTGNTYAR